MTLQDFFFLLGSGPITRKPKTNGDLVRKFGVDKIDQTLPEFEPTTPQALYHIVLIFLLLYED